MLTATKVTAHLTTVYIIKDEKGKLHMLSYRPTDGYAGQRDSDQYSNAQGLFITNANHNIPIGPVICHRVYGILQGLDSVNGLRCTIVAWQRFIWDYSKPMGSARMSEKIETENWASLFVQYRGQAK